MGGGGAWSLADPQAGARSRGEGSRVPDAEPGPALSSGSMRRRLLGAWLGGACWLGFLTPPKLAALPGHYAPLKFLASEGPLPDRLPFTLPFSLATMVRHPLDRALSAYHWWLEMTQRMPWAAAECHAYAPPPNATLVQWLEAYPGGGVVVMPCMDAS